MLVHKLLVDLAPPFVTAKSWAICDCRTGEILFGKCENDRREIASLTKIMTCFVVVQIIRKIKLLQQLEERQLNYDQEMCFQFGICCMALCSQVEMMQLWCWQSILVSTYSKLLHVSRPTSRHKSIQLRALVNFSSKLLKIPMLEQERLRTTSDVYNQTNP